MQNIHINIIRPQRSNFDLGEQTTLKSYGYSWGAIEYKVQSIKVAFENVANFIMVFYLQLLWKYFMLLIFLLFSFSRMSLWPKSDFSRNAGNLNRLDMGRAKTLSRCNFGDPNLACTFFGGSCVNLRWNGPTPGPTLIQEWLRI